MTVPKDNPGATEMYKNHTFYFCSEACKEEFNKNRDKYATPAAMMM